MANIQIGKYKRPGIFLEEFDQSVTSSPSVDGISNFVMGVSKKGPFNTPIKLTNISDLESIYGSLDRNLERRGSFFHRTVSKMLESAPVYAMNLLLTDDDLDKVEFKSMSTSVGYKNDIKKEGPYRRLFDTTGFWKRDTESFLNLTKDEKGDDNRTFNLTNLSDRPITAFVFKSKKEGFDRTMLEWYGSIEKMPPYLNSKDLASDYLVDVVVVGGDWSNYDDLSVDSRWSSYFSREGLIKEKISDFAYDRNITLLGYYEGLSLVPYFRNLNGDNIFIETRINRDTDRTGLYCAFDNELVEDDFYNGKIDLLGNTIVNEEDDRKIDFLSYKESLTEDILIEDTMLGSPGNVNSVLGLTNSSIDIKDESRSTWYSEGSIRNIGMTYSNGVNKIELDITKEEDDPFVIINDKKVNIENGASFEISSNGYNESNNYYYVVIVVDDEGEFSIISSKSPETKPEPSSNDTVLGYFKFTIDSNGFSGVEYKPVSVEADGSYSNYIGTQITYISNGSFKVEFKKTETKVNRSNYEQYRSFKTFKKMVDLLDSPNSDKMAMLLNDNFDKYRLDSFDGDVISDIERDDSKNNSFVINTNLSDDDLSFVLDGNLVLYTVDNEFIVGKDGMESKNTKPDEIGVVGKNSGLYERFYNGIISSRDYFYENLINEEVDVEFEEVDGRRFVSIKDSNGDLLDLGLNKTDKIKIFGSTNDNFITINDVNVNVDGKSYSFEVLEDIDSEAINNVNYIHNDEKRYLNMYLDKQDNMFVTFNSDILTKDEISINSNNKNIHIKSTKSNLKQTIEIEEFDGYEVEGNKILVSSDRYSEIKVGDFLEADYNKDDLETGQVPKKLTRVVNKKKFIGEEDGSLIEITCDSSIKKTNLGTGSKKDLQTIRYVGIDNYASTYKAITFKGFKPRKDSLPDGTEKRQDDILNLVAKGTPMFKAITNKEAFDFRYLVDSFGLGLIENSKQQLVDICGDRLNVFGFLNMPSLRSFKNSSSPSFVDNEGVLQTSFIQKGGDPESNPSFVYSFGEGVGTTTVGYFTPYVKVNDNGRPLDMPPASFAATTYMRKHTSNVTSTTPWTIAAGTKNGKVTNVAGLEMDFNNEDIENLNKAMANPIVYKRRRGYIIETENTAQTLYNSALSYIHVREVLIELERELSRMLLDYQWDYNTPDVRAEIKLRADVICETFVNKNGLYNYFNKMDNENNNEEIIDNQMGVLDTYVEPIKGMGIIVNNLNILRTGAISSGGFIRA